MADPWLGINLINSAKYVHNPEGWTLQVTPTWYGRAMPEVAIYSAWKELDARYYIMGDYRSMYFQFVCHPLSQIARFKGNWNLDTWRPDVGLYRTMLAKCNP